MRAPEKLYAYSLGFFTQKTVRRILTLSGFRVSAGWPRRSNLIAVWGYSPTAKRGHSVAAATGGSLVTVEDAFIRSLFPARIARSAPLGLLIDRMGLHFDPNRVSDLETILEHQDLNDPTLLERANSLMERMSFSQITKYYGHTSQINPFKNGYVLVIDQVRGDASLTASGATQSTFDTMLERALSDYPDAKIVIKTHPENKQGGRAGYYERQNRNDDRITVFDSSIDSWTLLQDAQDVYTVSSQLGFEAIILGKKPRVFGGPFYAGWGLSHDEREFPRRTRVLSKEQLFAAAMILYPKWYNPFEDKLCELEDVLAIAEAERRAWEEDRKGWDALEIRLWDRKFIRDFFGQYANVSFGRKDKNLSRPIMYWASKAPQERRDIVRVEDGFLRSRGLGAELVAPLSLICDSEGIYYDPTHSSQLETLIKAHTHLRSDQIKRARDIIERLRKSKITKYNLKGNHIDLPFDTPIHLVIGQVEDDASIKLGTDQVKTNLDLLKHVRAGHPDDFILYKPHPDVEAGLRMGKIATDMALQYADIIAENADILNLFDLVNTIHTTTSNTGFEALIRGKKVVTYGAPFYAG